ncbi:unnamed protein product [Musa acuminata subsp. malaccensis]|uniref:(wild Malaysian banana) hypothetical protein n=1 Tax=Musa acuminata subsp. malaccensis TaxID=214687 RepID=A0A804KDB3_MUSAM|nr:unnamed protein product [Musa acuminata subsp. malaccensis]
MLILKERASDIFRRSPYRGALGNVEMLTPKKGTSSILNTHSRKGMLVSEKITIL